MNQQLQLSYQDPLVRLGRRLLRQIEASEQSLREQVASLSHAPAASSHAAGMASKGVDTQGALAESGEQMLEDVEAALRRILDGSFGTCQDCGRDIAPARLNAIPFTPWCADCAAMHEEPLEPAD